MVTGKKIGNAVFFASFIISIIETYFPKKTAANISAHQPLTKSTVIDPIRFLYSLPDLR